MNIHSLFFAVLSVKWSSK